MHGNADDAVVDLMTEQFDQVFGSPGEWELPAFLEVRDGVFVLSERATLGQLEQTREHETRRARSLLADYRAAPSEAGAREVADAMIRANAAYLLYQRLTKNQDQSGLPFQRGNPQQWVPAADN